MKKKLIVLSLFLMGMAILLVVTSFKANAGVLMAGKWIYEKNEIVGCRKPGSACGITPLPSMPK